jgi:hypothetical protein
VDARDFRVTDPAGHQLTFTGRNLHANPEELSRMRAMIDRHDGHGD